MVISHILGGIGNQMFQYAAGYAHSLTIGHPYQMDVSDFANYHLHHGFDLKRVFNIPSEIASESTVNEMLGWRANWLAMKVLRRQQFVKFRGANFIVEPHFNYWPGLSKVTDDCYLYGYWQSERYFKSHEKSIRQNLTFKEALADKNAALAKEISATQSVSLHVRRGDYVSDSKTSSIMDVCSVDYYKEAIKYLTQKFQNPVLYIFSDDMEWVKRNLSPTLPCTYVNHNTGLKSYRDMQLMSLCQHHVIANSSFSWWGAWLNPRHDKLVVAPKSWFRNGNDDRDLIPSEWVRL